MAKTKINWNISPPDARKLTAILDRYERLVPRRARPKSYDRLNLRMDLIACHLNGTPLDLDRLQGAEDFTFLHDLSGIAQNIDRQTGKIANHFHPRCAA